MKKVLRKTLQHQEKRKKETHTKKIVVGKDQCTESRAEWKKNGIEFKIRQSCNKERKKN